MLQYTSQVSFGFCKRLWIAFRFCIFVLWTQRSEWKRTIFRGCELLSDFVYSFFEHNFPHPYKADGRLWIAFRFCIFVLWTQLFSTPLTSSSVVNCFQILYIRSLNTTFAFPLLSGVGLWIAFRFCIFVLWTQQDLCRTMRYNDLR